MEVHLKFLSKALSKIYRISYFLLPDRLQAEQLLMDAVQVWSCESLDAIAEEEGTKFEREVITLILKMGKKRATQLGQSLFSEELAPVYKLNFLERSALAIFMIDIPMSLDEIAKCLNIKVSDLFSSWEKGVSFLRPDWNEFLAEKRCPLSRNIMYSVLNDHELRSAHILKCNDCNNATNMALSLNNMLQKVANEGIFENETLKQVRQSVLKVFQKQREIEARKKRKKTYHYLKQVHRDIWKSLFNPKILRIYFIFLALLGAIKVSRADLF